MFVVQDDGLQVVGIMCERVPGAGNYALANNSGTDLGRKKRSSLVFGPPFASICVLISGSAIRATR
jgi:hypothetical protein